MRSSAPRGLRSAAACVKRFASGHWRASICRACEGQLLLFRRAAATLHFTVAARRAGACHRFRPKSKRSPAEVRLHIPPGRRRGRKFVDRWGRGDPCAATTNVSNIQRIVERSSDFCAIDSILHDAKACKIAIRPLMAGFTSLKRHYGVFLSAAPMRGPLPRTSLARAMPAHTSQTASPMR